jgi:hypothetical protein
MREAHQVCLRVRRKLAALVVELDRWTTVVEWDIQAAHWPPMFGSSHPVLLKETAGRHRQPAPTTSINKAGEWELGISTDTHAPAAGSPAVHR